MLTNSVINWVGFTIQVIGLLLITIELYLPPLAERLKTFLERIQFRLAGKPATKQYWNWVAIVAYIVIWVISVAVVSIMDPPMSIVANVAFTLFTVFLGVVIFVSKVFVRLGIVLGRGNVIGGVGLVLALIGFTIEISKMVFSQQTEHADRFTPIDSMFSPVDFTLNNYRLDKFSIQLIMNYA